MAPLPHMETGNPGLAGVRIMKGSAAIDRVIQRILLRCAQPQGRMVSEENDVI